MVENAAGLATLCLKQKQVKRLEQGEVTVDLDLKEEVGELRAAPHNALRSLWILEAQEACFRQRVDRHDARAVLLCRLERGQHSWVIRAGVLTGNDDEFCLVEVVEQNAAFPDADRFRQRRAARFVAHVRAVRQIIGTELPNEQLIGKRSFVAGAAGGVKHRFIRTREGLQFARDQVERVVPLDSFVVPAALAFDDGVGQPTLLPEPVAVAFAQVVDGVLPEEVRPNSPDRSFLGNRLRAALTELRDVVLVAFRPRAGRAVEARTLIEGAQRGQGAGGPHLAQGIGHRAGDPWDAGSPRLRLCDRQLVAPAGHSLSLITTTVFDTRRRVNQRFVGGVYPA